MFRSGMIFVHRVEAIRVFKANTSKRNSTVAPQIRSYFRIELKFLSPQSTSMGDPSRYRPCDVFTAMGRCWVLEDEFSYPINPNPK
ncbi:hypothetical protein ACB092_09G168300 [Castanea dentata]